MSQSTSSPEIETTSEYQKLAPTEFINISKWAIKFVYAFSPKYFSVYFTAQILNYLWDIGNILILAKIIDTVVVKIQTQSPQIQEIYNLLAIILGYNLMGTIISNLSNWAFNCLQHEADSKVSRAFYTKVNSLGIQVLERPGTNNLINRADRYMHSMLSFTDFVVTAVSNLVRAVVLLAIVIKFSWIFALIIFILSIPFYFIDSKNRTKNFKFIHDQTEPRRKANTIAGYLTDTPSLPEIYITNSFKFLDQYYYSFMQWSANFHIKLEGKWRMGIATINLLSEFIIIFFVANIFSGALAGLYTAGTALFRYRILEQLEGGIRQFYRSVSSLSERAIRISDVYKLYNLPSYNSEAEHPFPKLSSGPAINFENVSFKYENANKYVIENLNLNIKRNEKVAIVGQNGAGKTTIVKLICKFYDLNSGEIKINNNKLSEISTADWHKNIAALFQEYNKYSQLTVKENILIGKPDEPIDEVAIRLAAEQADASEFINKYPNGFDQVLNERYKGGIRPSTGQWQKIAIARFFYRNSPLVIFDEPTASIDAVSEYNIFNKIYEFFKDKTVIIISHRFSTVRNADRIIVLDEGKIIEEGSHDQLMSQNGAYAKAFLLQAKGYVDTIA